MAAFENTRARRASFGVSEFGGGGRAILPATPTAHPHRLHAEIFSPVVDYRGANQGCEPASLPATIGFRPGSHLLTIANVCVPVRTANRVRTTRQSSHGRLSAGSQRRFGRTVEIKEIKRGRR